MLKASSDRKVATGVTKSGSVRVKNAFGLPSGNNFSCPGATAVCASVCYAGKIEKMYTGARNLLMHNWELLSNADYDKMVSLLSELIDGYRAEATRKKEALKFRIHWDGDFFSIDYARAWATVVKANPDIQFWVYTRSFVPALNVVPEIAGIPNLTVYLSVDSDNMTHAAQVLIDNPGVLVATLAKTASEAKAMLPDAKPMACPEVIGKLPLVTNKREGACITCGLCVVGRKNVAFASSGKE